MERVVKRVTAYYREAIVCWTVMVYLKKISTIMLTTAATDSENCMIMSAPNDLNIL